jgi:glucose/arabinose dehydrogenase
MIRSFVTASALAVAITAPAAAQQQQTVRSSAGNLNVQTVAAGLANPWAIAFLPDGRLLVTERAGRLRVVTPDGKISPAVTGVPRVWVRGQGGLHDVALDRNFAQNRTIYLCFADEMPGGARTALARARFNDGAAPSLDEVQVIFRQEGPPSTGIHFGCRIAQAGDGNLFLTTGDHGSHRNEAQNLGSHLGKTIRIRPDGSVPPDNPFVNRQGAKPEIWSYGHRNMQGAAINPASGKLWTTEHGPRGGDEINIDEAGKNYGWPVIGYGLEYSGARAHESTHREGMEQPIKQWTPVIAASGMAFYQGNLFPAWKGNLFVGGLASNVLVRVTLDGDKVTGEERLLGDVGERIRDVRAGPDGAIWVATDSSNGRILRVSPAN